MVACYGCPLWLVILLDNHGKKGRNHILHNPLAFCLFYTSFQQITFPECTNLQCFIHNNSVVLQYKKLTKSFLYNFNFLNNDIKGKRNNVLSKN